MYFKDSLLFSIVEQQKIFQEAKKRAPDCQISGNDSSELA